MKIDINKLEEAQKKHPVLSTSFPKTSEFVQGLNWLAWKTGISFHRLSKWTGTSHLQQRRYTSNRIRRDDGWIVEEISREARARLSLLLLMVGYSKKEIFDTVFVKDFAFRHSKYHKGWHRRLKFGKKQLLKHWCASEIIRDIRSREGSADVVEQSIADFIAANPEHDIDAKRMRSYLFRHFDIDLTWIDIQNRKFGNWKPLMNTTQMSSCHKQVVCSCSLCGHRKWFKKYELLGGLRMFCRGCVKRAKQRQQNKQRKQRRKQLLFDVMTGRRFNTEREMVERYSLQGVMPIEKIKRELNKTNYITLGEHKFVLITTPQYYSRSYSQYLEALGLPTDYIIPSDPDLKDKQRQQLLMNVAKHRKLVQSARYQRQELRRRLSAPYWNRVEGFWSTAHIKEHRQAMKEKRPQMLAKVREEDEFLSSQLQ